MSVVLNANFREAIPYAKVLASKEGVDALTFLKDYIADSQCAPVISKGPLGHFFFSYKNVSLLNLRTGDSFSWRREDEAAIAACNFAGLDVEALCLTLGLVSRATDPVEAFFEGATRALLISTVGEWVRFKRIEAICPAFVRFREVYVTKALSDSLREDRI